MTPEAPRADRPFVLRPYSKAELASLYIPHRSRRVTLRRFNSWLRFDPVFWKQLKRTGLGPKTREYTFAQVKLIVDHLGEP